MRLGGAGVRTWCPQGLRDSEVSGNMSHGARAQGHRPSVLSKTPQVPSFQDWRRACLAELLLGSTYMLSGHTRDSARAAAVPAG